MIHDAMVSRARFDEAIRRLGLDVAVPAAGLFGPESLTWKIDREAALFLGAGRAALLQTAHPWVAEAIKAHSSTMTDPMGRFHRTFTMVFSMVFGACDQAFDFAGRLHDLHSHIEGRLKEAVGPFPAASVYRANNVDALRWVYATLIDTTVVCYELMVGPLSAAEKETFYRESKRFAALFGLAGADLPRDWAGFCTYNKDMWASQVLTVSTAGREIGDFLLSAKVQIAPVLAVRVPGWYGAITASLLPARIRREYGLALSDKDQDRAARALRWIRTAYPRLPAALRYVPPYHEACARLAGRRPGPVTQTLNRLWVGRPRLVGL